MNHAGKIKKIALINDIAGYGRCSMTAAIPVISAMGVQCCPMETAVLSNHTGYPDAFFDDYTDRMPAYMDAWNGKGGEGDKEKQTSEPVPVSDIEGYSAEAFFDD